MIEQRSLAVVSIGVPVRNGAASIAAALDSLVNQTFRNLEIVISDNASTDETAAICQAYAARDGRIRYVRQERLIPATQNFAFVRSQAQGRYFMWAAHDDTRDLTFVASMTDALERSPNAVLAMGDVIEVEDGKPRPRDFDFQTVGLSRAERMRRAAIMQCFHIYGLWRLEALRRIPLRDGDWWSDSPIMMAGCCLGDYIHVGGTHFMYKINLRAIWPRVAAFDGFKPLARLASLLRRAFDLFVLVWSAVVTVKAVAGPFWGALAGIFAVEKVMRQIAGHFARRTARLWAQ